MKTHLPSLARVASRLVLLCGLGLTLLPAAKAQQNPLNRKITLHLAAVQLDDALFAIGRAGGFDFSYNASTMPTDSVVRVDADAESVRRVLDRLVGSRYDIRPIGNHLLIARRKPAPRRWPPWAASFTATKIRKPWCGPISQSSGLAPPARS